MAVSEGNYPVMNLIPREQNETAFPLRKSLDIADAQDLLIFSQDIHLISKLTTCDDLDCSTCISLGHAVTRIQLTTTTHDG